MHRTILLSLLIPAAVLADAGYLGSVAQGPVPLGNTTEARLVCQDVLIEVDRSAYRLTGDFLIASPKAEDVWMYFPVDIVTPFVSALWSATEPGFHLDRVDVTVDGDSMEVVPLYMTEWDPNLYPGIPWDSLAAAIRPLYPGEPAAGEPLAFTRMPTESELAGRPVSAEGGYPAFPVQSMSAAWRVGLQAGDTVLVEYAAGGDMTTDYQANRSILCYPLQTGSSWEGSIERGRVTVVPASGAPPDVITFAAGVMLPPPVRSDGWTLDPLDVLASQPAFEASRLAGLAGREWSSAIVWEFEDFEPAVAPTGWRALHPGLGDMYAMVADSLTRWRMGETDFRPRGWTGSYVYLYLSDRPPEGLTAIAMDGLPLMTEPFEDAERLAEVPATCWMEVLEWSGSWARVDVRIDEYRGGGDAGEHRGWVRLDRTDDGLVLPAALPML